MRQSDTPLDLCKIPPITQTRQVISRALAQWRGGLYAAFATATGATHSHNEDGCIHFPAAERPVFCAVADGVGGGAHGEVASQALLQHCAAAPADGYRDPAKLAEWLKQSDEAVREAVARRGTRRGASTLVAAWFCRAGRVHLTNIGDCRAYRLWPRGLGRTWRIAGLTQDQTYANLNRQPPAGSGPDDPACMAGVGAVRVTPVLPIRLNEGELLLLCSDGLHKFVPDLEISQIVADGLAGQVDLKQVCHRLIMAAQNNGSHDDVSALLVQRRRWFGAGMKYWGWLAFVIAMAWLTGIILDVF